MFIDGYIYAETDGSPFRTPKRKSISFMEKQPTRLMLQSMITQSGCLLRVRKCRIEIMEEAEF